MGFDGTGVLRLAGVSAILWKHMKKHAMNRIISITVSVLALTASLAWAQLGETPDQCNRRFGKESGQTGPSGCWAFARDYTKGDLHIVVRFLEFTIGSTNVGWISCATIPESKDAGALRDSFRLGVVPKWESLEEVPVPDKVDPREKERLKASNAIVAATRKTILAAAGWKEARCWATPTMFAADDGHTVILFSNIYLARSVPNSLPIRY